MTSKKVYWLSLGAVLLTSAYPIYMGSVMLSAYIQNGGIDVADYPKYIIPYTPICIALIICTALLPLVLKLFKKFALPVLSGFGALLFFVSETGFEKIAVFTDYSTKTDIETWQLFACVVTTQVRQSIWDSLSIRYNSSFKIHFYAISLLIILAVIGVIYGFYKMAHTQNYEKKKPLIVQLVSVAVFIGLCILACFTAFFRTGDINLSPVSAILTILFFLIFGITAGVYTGTWFYGKRKMLSAIIPSDVAVIVTLIMYIGEMVMMDGNLYRLGSGFLFDRLGLIPFAIADILAILLSGMNTYLILDIIKPHKSSQKIA